MRKRCIGDEERFMLAAGLVGGSLVGAGLVGAGFSLRSYLQRAA